MKLRYRLLSGLVAFMAVGLLAACSSSSGGSDAKPNTTYIIVPNGQAVPTPTPAP